MRIAYALIALAGCDAVLRLQEVSAPGPAPDALAPDAPPCDQMVDEDCDGLPNDTDPCPADNVAPIDADADGDTVGDACDPAAGPSNHRAWFDGFAQDDGMWTITMGQGFTFANGAATPNGFDAAIVHPVSARVPWLAETWIEGGSANTSNPRVLLELTGGTANYGCQVTISANATLLIVGSGSSKTFTGTGRLRVAARLVGTMLTCEAGYANGATAQLSATITPFAVTGVQLQTGGIKASFDSVFVASGP